MVQALGRASEESLRIRPEFLPRQGFPDQWGLFASDTIAELATRRQRHGNALTYTAVELRRLRNDIVACGVAWTEHQSLLASTAEFQPIGGTGQVHRVNMVAARAAGVLAPPVEALPPVAAPAPSAPTTPPPAEIFASAMTKMEGSCLGEWQTSSPP